MKDFGQGIIEPKSSEVYVKLGAYCLVVLFERFRAPTLSFEANVL